MLHIIKTPNALQELCTIYQNGDQVLLIEDSVYAANAHHPMFTILKSMDVLALEADTQARGVFNRISPSITMVDYVGFVNLTAQHTSSLTWE